jgi:hypothetical protein
MRRGTVAREARRTAAEARQAQRDSRTDEQQLKKLTDAGHSHCKEALRLAGFSKEWAKRDEPLLRFKEDIYDDLLEKEAKEVSDV